MLIKFGLRLIPNLPNCIDSETYVKRLFKFVVKGGPFFGWHYIKLAIVALKLLIPFLSLFSNSIVLFFRTNGSSFCFFVGNF